MALGGKRPGAGRPPKSQNKATVQASLLAVRDIEAARASGRELAKDKLEKFLGICEGAAGLFRPSGTDGSIEKAPQDWTLFAEWMDRAIYCAAQLAKYQSPTFKAIHINVDQPTTASSATIDGKTGQVIDLATDVVALQARYQRMIKAIG